MYVIKRIDKTYGGFTTEHKTLDEAREEAKRLATKHVRESAEFKIYELSLVKTVTAEISVIVTEKK